MMKEYYPQAAEFSRLPYYYYLLRKMNPQYNSSYQNKQFIENRINENAPRRHKARESQPPMMGAEFENAEQYTTEYNVRKPRQSQMAPQTKNSNNNPQRNLLNQNLEPSRRGINQTKQDVPKNREDYTFSKKQELTLQNPPRKQPSQFSTIASNKVLPTNRFQSPELKYMPQHHTERKYSQNFQDTFFKGHKPSAPNLHSKQPPSKNQLKQLQKQFEISQSKRLPRKSQPNTFPQQLQDEDVFATERGTNSYIVEKSPKEYKQYYNKQVKEIGSLKQKDLPKVKSPQIIPSEFNPERVKESVSQFNNPGNVFKKQKELKQTVSTHSTFNSNRLEVPLVNNLMNKKLSKSDRPEKSELTVSDFIKGKELGSGKFGEVCVVRHKRTGFVCAMKSIPKAMILQQNIINQLIRELKIQSFLDHPNIIKLYGFFHDKNYIYLLLELGSSGQLYRVIKERQRLPELSVSYIIKQVCQAIRYLHHFKIIHRDLKPENIVIQNGTIKICDFGWAVARGGELRSTFCGTPLYVSPEILKGQLYDEKIDLWAIGILTYELLFGNIPFEISTEEELIKIVKEDIVFPTNIKISPEAKDFILRILKKNPDERLKVTQLMQHQFLKKCPEGAIELES